MAGCYTHPESHGDWNFNTYKMWYRGVTMFPSHDMKKKKGIRLDKKLFPGSGAPSNPSQIQVQMWYRGVTMLYDVHDGFAEGIEFVTQDRIKRLYA